MCKQVKFIRLLIDGFFAAGPLLLDLASDPVGAVPPWRPASQSGQALGRVPTICETKHLCRGHKQL
jgi:hypothetical protein